MPKLRVTSAGLLTLFLLAVLVGALPVATAQAAPLAFVYGSSLDGQDPNLAVVQQDFASGSVTQLGYFGQHMVWWSLSHRYSVTTAARYDEAYMWLNVSIHDGQTGTTTRLKDVYGNDLPEAPGWISFGGFSADGSRFALAVKSDADLSNGLWSTPMTMIFDSATGHAVGQTSCSDTTGIAISPDGTRAVYSYGADRASALWMFTPSAGTDDIWMTSDELGVIDRDVNPYWPTHSQEIVVNTLGDTGRQRGVSLIDPNTRELRVINSQTGDVYDVTPDGQYAIIASQPFSQPIGHYELGRLRLSDGAYARTLSVSQFAHYPEGIRRATLSPDGTRVLFEGWLEKGEQGHPSTYPANIYRCTFTGTGLSRVAMDARNPSWVAGDVASIQSTHLSVPKLSTSRPRKGRKVQIATTLTPSSGIAGSSVKLALYHWETKKVRKNGRTVRVSYWHLRSTKTMGRKGSGRCWLDYKPPYTGKWKVQATYSGTINYFACNSGQRTFRVK